MAVARSAWEIWMARVSMSDTHDDVRGFPPSMMYLMINNNIQVST